MNVHSIDIVIPTYRLDEKVISNIASLRCPDLFDVYVYVVADNPALVIPESVKQLYENGKIKLIVNERNLGASATRNAGIQYGKSKWILLLE